MIFCMRELRNKGNNLKSFIFAENKIFLFQNYMILNKLKNFSNIKHTYNLRSVIKNPLKSIGKRNKHRKGQKKFREKLIKRYDSK